MLIVELEALEHSGREAFQYYVSPIDETQNDIASARRFEIDRSASFAGIEVVVTDRTFRTWFAVFERTERAKWIDSASTLNLDNVRAKIGQVSGRSPARPSPN